MIAALVAKIKGGMVLKSGARRRTRAGAAKDLLPIAQAGQSAKIYFISGVREAKKLGAPINASHEKMHIKGGIFDPLDVANSIAMALQSGNISGNAFMRNRETYSFQSSAGPGPEALRAFQRG